ncbi:hypothetical protein FPV21_07365 [Carnobacterium sp. PL12RED10]|uniref:hypothetical protein n=1 Tax=Carnobacterium sp. PL12RED10 TaxID=2592351 RepID=UPI0011EFCF5D|nr:hypothetical protein [Carnobacterium sp. PL12RED10]KAF3299320.1 hypothetical protein FPV21_07365 [Carnobacterium sp. PL12RED10]
MEKDYFKLISFAKGHVENIKTLQEDLPNKDYLYLYLNMEIRYCLSDLQSALDYFAYTLFMKYQYPRLIKQGIELEKLENKQRGVYFPHAYKESDFNRKIKISFQGLQQDYPEIFSVFKDVQPFNFPNKDDSWLFVLNKYANESKHRNLTKTSKYQNANINYFEYGGNIFENNTFVNVGEAVNIGGITLTKEIAQAHGLPFDGEITTVSIFEESGKPIVSTLENIITHVEKLLAYLDMQLEEIK